MPPSKLKLLIIVYFSRGKVHLYIYVGKAQKQCLHCKLPLCSKGSQRTSALHLSSETAWICKAVSHTGRMLRPQPLGLEILCDI